MPDAVTNSLAPQTPEEIAAAAEAQVLDGADNRVATEYEGVTPGIVEDLDDPTISATVGPGALAQTLGREAAHEAAKQFPNESEPITPGQAALLGTVGNLGVQERALRATAVGLGAVESATVGEYYGNLATGQVVAGPQIPEDQRIGPFHSPALAKAAVAEAQRQYQNSADGTHPIIINQGL